MKKALLALPIFLVLSLIPLFAVAHNTVETERELLPVITCPQTDYEGIECATYSVKKGDTLSRLAKRYSSKERKLTAAFLLEINPYILKREIPESLKGYSGQPWNRTSADWLFDGDEITLPFVFEDEVERVKSKKMVGALVEGLVKENTKLHDRLNAVSIVLAVFALLAIVLFVWAMSERNRRHRDENQ